MKKLAALLFVCLLLGWPASTATEPQSPAGTEQATPAASGPKQGSTPAPPSGAGLERFEPTEELPADSAISFPVDI